MHHSINAAPILNSVISIFVSLAQAVLGPMKKKKNSACLFRQIHFKFRQGLVQSLAKRNDLVAFDADCSSGSHVRSWVPFNVSHESPERHARDLFCIIRFDNPSV